MKEVEQEKQFDREMREIDLSSAELYDELARLDGYDFALYAKTFIDNGKRYFDDYGCEIEAKIYVKNKKIDKIEATYCNDQDVIIRSFSYENDILRIVDNRSSIHFLKVIRK